MASWNAVSTGPRVASTPELDMSARMSSTVRRNSCGLSPSAVMMSKDTSPTACAWLVMAGPPLNPPSRSMFTSMICESPSERMLLTWPKDFCGSVCPVGRLAVEPPNPSATSSSPLWRLVVPSASATVGWLVTFVLRTATSVSSKLLDATIVALSPVLTSCPAMPRAVNTSTLTVVLNSQDRAW
jgi:hypothetical protein